MTEKRALDFMDEEDLADIIDDRALKLRAEADAKSSSTDDVNVSQRKSSPKSEQKLIPTADGGMAEGESNAVVALVNKQVKRTTAKPYSQVDEDEDIDGFDIAPTIKYDQHLNKKKKKSAASQHLFQPKKVLRNPEPEPETIQPTRDANFPNTHSTELTQLPSIGDWQVPSRVSTSSGQSPPGSMQASLKDENKRPSPIPIPPWRQQQPQPQAPVAESKVPPWRQKQETVRTVASTGKSIALLALKSTFTPYTNNPLKHERYQEYLRIEAEIQQGPHRQGDLEPDTWRAECEEFKKCAMMYKPMTSAMSQKFTSSVHKDMPSKDELDSTETTGSGVDAQRLEAARAATLLCKRYNISHPEVVDSKSGPANQEPSGTDINRSVIETLMRTV
ncbi:Putative uncharacterized protein [Taphrina deformans PYCC 5710]|uniref:Uncharacterized protein n=1 Tax=Taphrina deformans (strain PYCC 5710 / ATCC 11124 / CBS 356.35 / IMI 108563 / JCM 9778 / NBRC 8474) TaxID=1097556 RepID=R4XE21_TAPDE|nr:Putative uncharacterized protein [Taphrina deformans PYCC 5710]|eukprot:CCG81578.1 Putative uncharacterized protein [Taphrina deformans PYCC 5710]